MVGLAACNTRLHRLPAGEKMGLFDYVWGVTVRFTQRSFSEPKRRLIQLGAPKAADFLRRFEMPMINSR